ncbi:ADP-ribosylglycohydrolase family protein [Limnothrix sp. FACHB-708]|uniref:ADP-ribosylglycohydrolase family protein n=1 Tax=unclassified Limnothrix TaxID=2632864 RepID=UPI001687D745|nr:MULTISPECIES: ADP-ribosylglycohydrolase family protein [unclassified Limnothrix]MBD2555073.1 ADP-ribosylglycohydrolase family protein [Limnothrix sp. FACHB-708]MBD2591841.1 ADP-ribosylglycohydrolase family protein [Limnothrix sp. FACHB-406]
MLIPSPDQFAGSLVGQCLADAVGCRVEGYPPEVCANFVAQEVRLQQIGDRDRFPFPFGQYTDDSQLARELAQSYVAQGGFDPADYAARIAAIFAEERIVGRGLATESAAERLIQGVPWHEAGVPAPSAGNGSAMRAAPIGWFFSHDPDKLIAAACDQGYITHQDPRCSAGAVAIAGAVALALRGGAINPPDFLGQLSTWVAQVDRPFGEWVQMLTDWVLLSPTEAAVLIANAGRSPDQERSWPGISPFVIPSVLWSLYAFLRSPADYWETVCTSITVGGDVDTTAAMAGAISGAYLGLMALPQALAAQVNDRGSWGYQDLVNLAHQCHQQRFGKNPPTDRSSKEL